MTRQRVGIVTGGSSGLGLVMARHLAEMGYRVYAISRHGKASDDQKEPENLHHLQGDVSDFEGMKILIENIGQQFGLDFLINNAGVTLKKRAELVSLKELEMIQNINVNAPYLLSSIAYPYLKQAPDKGRIINIASMAAHLGFSEVVPYCVTKSAILGLTRGLAVEWRQENIRVNSISPGWFPSELTKQVMDDEREAKIMNKIALDEFGDPMDIATMVAYLLAKENQYITGQDFAIDGGALAFGY